MRDRSPPRSDAEPRDAAIADVDPDAAMKDSETSDADRFDAEPEDGSSIDAGSIDAGSIDTGAADTGVPDAGGPGIPLCYSTCAIPADCATPGSVLTDADNYACSNGLCQYTGCTGTPECAAVFGADYVCVLHPGATFPGCVKACATPADCVLPSPLFDMDNYACTSGGCQWLGCTAADECRTVYNDPTYVCEPQAGLTFMNCVRPCGSPSDCGTGQGAFDADNYACTGARCEYLGCTSTAECMVTFPMGSYECR
jgi:hypothetical protein